MEKEAGDRMRRGTRERRKCGRGNKVEWKWEL
jgi:hypothetical protein